MKCAYRYERQLTIAASHFNDGKAYDQPERIAIERVHGHDFIISVRIDSNVLNKDGFVFDDEIIDSLANDWQHKNLSRHPDFAGERATAENMARRMCEKIMLALRMTEDAVESIRVSVQEGPGRKATCRGAIER